MRAFAIALAFVLFALGPRVARADDAVRAAKGIAVLAADGATDAAWPLARAVYASELLRPEGIDDEHARVLAGEKRETQQPSIVELQELRAGVKGDDAASRQVLGALADKLGVASILVVFAPPNEKPTAQLFDAKSRTFDAARYSPDANGAWDGTIRSLERPLLPAPVIAAQSSASASSAASTAPVAPGKQEPHESKSKPFYQSPWFWVAIGTAVLVGGGILIGTQVQTGDTIHLQLKMP